MCLQQRNLAERVPTICPAESAANTLLNIKFIHYYCWVFRRQDEQNQHQSPTDGTREGQLQAYGALHKACKRTWNPLPPELWHFRYTGSRKIQLSELTVTPQIPLLYAAQSEKIAGLEEHSVQRCNLSCGSKGSSERTYYCLHEMSKGIPVSLLPFLFCSWYLILFFYLWG